MYNLVNNHVQTRRGAPRASAQKIKEKGEKKMTKKNIIKFAALLMLVTVLTSIFSLPVFAEAESSDEVNNDEELLFEDSPWWEQVGIFIFGVIFIILAIPIHIIVGISSVIKELIPILVEFWESIF